MTADGIVTVSIVGTEAREGGGVAPTPSGTVATTPAGQPDLRINVVSPIIAIFVRFVKAFLTGFSGAIGADVTGVIDFHGSMLTAALLVGFWGAFANFIKDLITVFGRLEGKYPLATGSI